MSAKIVEPRPVSAQCLGFIAESWSGDADQTLGFELHFWAMLLDVDRRPVGSVARTRLVGCQGRLRPNRQHEQRY
jgi:hypothetical protein